MDNLLPGSDDRRELDDKGCAQDESPKKKDCDMETDVHPQLLDLSDDVLLYIFRHCSPRDLKALGFSCQRLGTLIRDRTLWVEVDARAQPAGRARLRWLLVHALNQGTRSLQLSGYARQARGCLGHVNRTRKEAEGEKEDKDRRRRPERDACAHRCDAEAAAGGGASGSRAESSREEASQNGTVALPPFPLYRQHARFHINAQQLPRQSGSLSWPDDPNEELELGMTDPETCVLQDGSCPGPQFTLTQCMLRQLRTQCSRLTSLSLEYCNINCRTTGMNQFPATLTKLSLRGVKCYNLSIEKSFLFKIQDYLPVLELLDVSECDWMEPASLLPLSKMATLTQLLMRDCLRMSEFVAYASLATRYGFRNLKVLDLRGSPVGDSEVSALGWMPKLEELYLSPAGAPPPAPRDHSHYKGDALPAHNELEPWEVQEPDYFRIKQPAPPSDSSPDASIVDIDEHIEHLRTLENNMCLHGTDFNLCAEGIRIEIRSRIRDIQEIRNLERQHDLESARARAAATARCRRELERKLEKEREKEATKRKPKENGSGDSAETNKPGPAPKRKKPDTKDETKKTPTKRKPNDSDSSDDDSDVSKKICHCPVNEGASTSKSVTESKRVLRSASAASSSNSQKAKTTLNDKSSKKRKQKSESESSDDDLTPPIVGAAQSAGSDSSNSESPERECMRPLYEQYVRFSQNQDPVFYQCPVVRRPQEPVPEPPPEPVEPPNQEAEAGGHHVLYVNVGQQLHAVYRLLPSRPTFHSVRNRSYRANVRSLLYGPPTPHLDSTSLVTDSAIRRFGRADGENVNYVNIGPNGPYLAGEKDPGARPSRSNLRILSVTGFRHISDRSLVHLATAAPYLRLLDFSQTTVTQQGVDNFRSLRPDCEVKFSEYVDKNVGTE